MPGILRLITIKVLLFTLLLIQGSFANPLKAEECGFKNVIVMVPDGCGISIQTLARFYKGAPLNLDRLNSGAVRTHCANSMITDSAAAATAFATGHKTTSGFLGLGPREHDLMEGFTPTASPYMPAASVLEGAKLKGMATGLVATASIYHATPAGFASHVPSRKDSSIIIKQMVYQDLDVAFGGGLEEISSKYSQRRSTQEDSDKKNEDLLEVLMNRGYKFVDNVSDMLRLKKGPAWGLFRTGNLTAEIDRKVLSSEEPSLAQMTEKAIELLSQNKKGFFLMVEGSQVDFAGHANDPVYMVTEFLAFDEAVGKAVDFAKKDGNTLVIIFADHNTGGLSLGNNGKFYNEKSYSMGTKDFIRTVKNAKTTIYGLSSAIYSDDSASADEITEVFKDKWNLDLTEKEASDILAIGKNHFQLADYINENFTAMGWTTLGHTAEDVPLWAYSSRMECLPHGNMDNTEIAHLIAGHLGFDLKEVTKRLYIDVKNVFREYEMLKTDEGPVLKIGDFLLPANRDMVIKGKETFKMNGIVVYEPNSNKFFIPREAVDIIGR